MKHIVLCALIFVIISGCKTTSETAPTPIPVPDPPAVEKLMLEKKPKNIILLIGDGMGLAQVSAAQYFSENSSNFDRFPVIGLIKTSASDKLVTDSAAGATAFASGIKTYNGAVGVDPNKKSVPTIIENISKEGMATGVIATSSITHATPACFYAHVDAISSALPLASTCA